MKLDSTYENPFLAHATMEPMNCTVQVTPTAATSGWARRYRRRRRTPSPRRSGFQTEQVRIHNHYIGGGFGRRLEADFIVQAALFAKQVDYPVKIVWSREEDIQHDMYRPYYYDRISGGLDETGQLVAWNHRIVGSSIMARFFPAAFKNGLDCDAVDGAIDLAYDIPNFHVDYVREEPPDVPTAFWRGVGPTRNGYVVESFIDEMAAAAKQDPVAFRRTLLGKSPRAMHVIERAAEMSGWGTPLGPAQGTRRLAHEGDGKLSRPGRRGDRRRQRRSARSTVSFASSTPASPSIRTSSSRRWRAGSSSASPPCCGVRSRSRTGACSSRTSTTTA